MTAGRLRFEVLGDLRAKDDGTDLALGGPKQRMALAPLLLEPNRVVSVDRLCEVLWGDDAPDNAVGVLHVHVSKLRRVLQSAGNEVIVTRRPGYLAVLGAGQLDLAEFDELVTQARAARESAALAESSNLFRLALSLWRGPTLADLRDQMSIASLVAPIDERRLQVWDECIQVDLSLGRHSEVMGEIEGLVEAEPLRESFVGALMLARYRCGRQADALAAYSDLSERLVDELGLDPTAEVQAIRQSILRQDPLLLLTDAQAAASPTRKASALGPSDARLDLPNGTSLRLADATVVLGRHHECDVVLTDSEVSRRHAELRPHDGGYVLVDLDSTNGTFVAGARVSSHDLASGDRIRIGSQELRYTRVADPA